MSHDREALREEFSAADGTFLLEVRMLVWDPIAFSRLEGLMRAACLDLAGQDTRERWMVEGFWILSDWLSDWTSHPNFPRPESVEYYEAAIRRMQDLQYWFVMGESLYEPDHAWEPL